MGGRFFAVRGVRAQSPPIAAVRSSAAMALLKKKKKKIRYAKVISVITANATMNYLYTYILMCQDFCF